MISATGVHKAYGGTAVLEGVDLDVPTGAIFALLGPNGAGKTTTVNILTTLIRPDAGSIRIDGADPLTEPDAVRAAIGVTGQFAAVDALLTGEENLILIADLLHLGRRPGRKRAAELLELFDLTAAARRAAATYSGGMRRRLDIAMGLVATPRVVFLDEPTTGLDPRGRRAMWETIRGLAAGGVTIFLTTQYLEEADHLADKIDVLHHGRIVASGTPAELKRLVPGGHVTLTFAEPAGTHTAARALGLTPPGDQTTLNVPGDGSVPSLRALLATLDAAGVELEGLAVHTPDLDDVFLALTATGAPR
ncbi:daunorubicin resistance protein DrrA family ABC transporter ATP-binding protein [Winogradskya consettensis]|uniref:Daunorubicin resistance protein DrrA family ABC transporter ATP-binding protein n=1 Tax=Winogradskya consettensis TaxID=113560 RepID=A0A919VQC6_9ACTN|nr:ATP-binding cassette domain-containing protein [Actinoplanes consettensis]GIM74769.1 daunorubicin resistance protein DrrA family ABC transporter ATP-binding protein [Actinoplanes consettensis]